MNYLSKYLILSFLGLSFTMNAFSQEEYFDSLLIEEQKVENRVYKPVIGAGYGVLNFFGDVNDNFRLFSGGMPGGKVYVSTYMDKNHFWKFDFFAMFGSLTGNERGVNRNLNFKSQVTSFGLNLHYEFPHLIQKERVKVTPFVEIGLGTLQFNAKGDLLDAQGNNYIYGEDGTIQDQNNELAARDYVYETDLRSLDLYGLGAYSQFGLAFPLGIGFNANLTERISLRIGTSFYLTTTDLIDNVSHKGQGIEANKSPDFFSFSTISLHFDLFSEPAYITVEKMFADYDADDLLTGDSDHDWILDFGDQCPATPFGVEIDSMGCAIDDDRDGVPNYLDKEPNTPFTAFIDDEGSEIPDSVLAALLQPGMAIDRSDLEYYLKMVRETDKKILSRPEGIPIKFRAFDLDNDNYLSFEELLHGITQYFDFRTFLSLQDIYEMLEFYFSQE